MVVIPGQPLTINHAYKRATIRQRQPNGTVRTFPKMVKTDEAVAYQTVAALSIRLAAGSWRPPTGFVRIKYTFYVNPDIDCDNVKKLVNDAVAKVLDVNDRWFLTCDVAKFKVPKGEQKLVLEISADSGHP